MLELFVSPWVHNLSPFYGNSQILGGNWGPGGIRWYGLSYLAGFVNRLLPFSYLPIKSNEAHTIRSKS